MAAANPNITADAIEATEFMDLSRKYRVTGVPKTIVNETIEIMGGSTGEDVRPGGAGDAGASTITTKNTKAHHEGHETDKGWCNDEQGI